MTKTKRAQKDRKPNGRPKILTAEVQDALITLVTEGKTVSESCKSLGISYSTVSRKEVDDEGFARVLARARVAGAARCLDEAEDKLRTATNQNITTARELAIHLRWKASKLMPLYSDKPTTALQVNVGAPMSALDREAQLLETARGMALVLDMAADVRGAQPAELPAPARQSYKSSPPYESAPAEPAGMKQSTEPEADPADDPDRDVTRGMAELDRADRQAEGEVGMHIRQQESRRPTVVNTARRPWPWRGRR